MIQGARLLIGEVTLNGWRGVAMRSSSSFLPSFLPHLTIHVFIGALDASTDSHQLQNAKSKGHYSQVEEDGRRQEEERYTKLCDFAICLSPLSYPFSALCYLLSALRFPLSAPPSLLLRESRSNHYQIPMRQSVASPPTCFLPMTSARRFVRTIQALPLVHLPRAESF